MYLSLSSLPEPTPKKKSQSEARKQPHNEKNYSEPYRLIRNHDGAGKAGTKSG